MRGSRADERLVLMVAGEKVEVSHRRPTQSELISALVRKMPRGSEDDDARRILMANFELGQACVTGLSGRAPGLETFREETDGGKIAEILSERAPLLLIALGQHLSQVPELFDGTSLKKP